ncbi:MAG: hypothetical protein Alpg2KO_09470 [Alphaproteobacteria bacterium]
MSGNKWVQRRRGASLLSYGLVVGLISVFALTAVTSTGSNVNSLFTEVETTLGTVASGATGGSSGATASPTPSGPTTCLRLFNAGTTSSGPQTIDLPGGGTTTLYCDMTDGGGWTLVGKIGINQDGHFTQSAVNIVDLANDTLNSSSEAKLSDSDIQGLASSEYRMFCRSSRMDISSSSCTFDATARADTTGCDAGGVGDAPSIEFGISDAVTDIAWNLSMGDGCEVGGDRDSGTLWVR